jgi:hypothetical protein
MDLSKARHIQYLCGTLIVIGTLLAIFGVVRSGSLLLALGTAAFSVTEFRRTREERAGKRKIEIILPLLISIGLFVVALTLPHAK